MSGAPSGQGGLLLCSLGVSPPGSATLEVLQALAGCDAVYLEEERGRGLAEEFCREVRLLPEGRSPRAVRLILGLLRSGRTVGILKAHPLAFGEVAGDLAVRCRRENIPCRALGALSGVDFLLAKTGKVLGVDLKGIQAVEGAALGRLRGLNARQPLVLYLREGISPAGAKRLRGWLGSLYPRSHPCQAFVPASGECSIRFPLDELPQRLAAGAGGLILYLPRLRPSARDGRP